MRCSAACVSSASVCVCVVGFVIDPRPGVLRGTGPPGTPPCALAPFVRSVRVVVSCVRICRKERNQSAPMIRYMEE